QLGDRALLGVEVVAEAEPGQDGTDERTDHLADQICGNVAPLCSAVDRKTERDRRVDVAARGERDPHTGEDSESPSDVDQQPAAVEAFGLGENDIRDDATTQKGQHSGAEQFEKKDPAEIEFHGRSPVV